MKKVNEHNRTHTQVSITLPWWLIWELDDLVDRYPRTFRNRSQVIEELLIEFLRREGYDHPMA